MSEKDDYPGNDVRLAPRVSMEQVRETIARLGITREGIEDTFAKVDNVYHYSKLVKYMLKCRYGVNNTAEDNASAYRPSARAFALLDELTGELPSGQEYSSMLESIASDESEK